MVFIPDLTNCMAKIIGNLSPSCRVLCVVVTFDSANIILRTSPIHNHSKLLELLEFSPDPFGPMMAENFLKGPIFCFPKYDLKLSTSMYFRYPGIFLLTPMYTLV